MAVETARTSKTDAVRDFLKSRGTAAHLTKSGLPGLVDRWERITEDVAAGYELSLEDLLADLDLRNLIAGALDVASAEEKTAIATKLAAADKRFRLHTESSPCLWGEDVAEDEGWTPKTHWWYFARPRRPGRELKRDLKRLVEES
jgi:hypothetical protein